jgi:hypothetical protein
MGLSKVWVQTVADGLVRADSIIGITAHPTPAIAGKPSRWLLDVVLATTTGSGSAGSWISNPLHRTLAQTDHPPANATTDLAGMLARLDATDAAGVITVARVRGEGNTVGVRFGFTPFSCPDQNEHRPRRTTPDGQGDASSPATR